MTADQLTPSEIERMRAILAQHDEGNAGEKNQSFDLNKPPKKPYRHQEFPRVVYHETGKHRAVKNADEFEAHLADGWSDQPVAVQAEAAPALDVDASAEAAAIDAKLIKRKR